MHRSIIFINWNTVELHSDMALRDYKGKAAEEMESNTASISEFTTYRLSINTVICYSLLKLIKLHKII